MKLDLDTWITLTTNAIRAVTARHDGSEEMPPATPDDYRFLGDLEPPVAAIFIILMRNQVVANKQLHDMAITAFNAGARR